MVHARTGRRAGALVAILAVVSMLGLGACGSDDGEVMGRNERVGRLDGVSGDRGIVLAAAVQSVDDGTARISARTEMGSLLSVSIDGVVDFDSGDSQMTLDMGAFAGFAGLTGEPGDSPDPADFGIEVRTVDGVVYMRLPEGLAGQFADTDGADTPWVAIDTATLATASGSDLGQLGEQADPRAYLSYLQRASDDIEATGREEVRGTDTTRYEGTLDLTKGLADLPDDARRQLEEEFGENGGEMLDQLGGQLGLDSLPFAVWIDDDGNMRKMEIDFDLGAMLDEQSSGEGGEGGEADELAGLLGTMLGGGLSVVVELYDYGVDVDVDAPPADEVTDLTPSDLGVPDPSRTPGADGSGTTDDGTAPAA